MPSECPGMPVPCHRVVSWALAATERSEPQSWDTCIGPTRETRLPAEGPAKVRHGWFEPWTNRGGC